MPYVTEKDLADLWGVTMAPEVFKRYYMQALTKVTHATFGRVTKDGGGLSSAEREAVKDCLLELVYLAYTADENMKAGDKIMDGIGDGAIKAETIGSYRYEYNTEANRSAVDLVKLKMMQPVEKAGAVIGRHLAPVGLLYRGCE